MAGSCAGVRYYFVEDPEYFDRDQLYGVAGKDYPDNAERFAEFSRAAIEFCKHVWMPEVIHCHDWQSALVPVLLRTQYEKDATVEGLPVVFTIHNMGYHGTFPREAMKKIGLPENLFTIDAMEFYGAREFPEGRADFFRLPDDGEPQVRGRNPDARVRTRARRRGAEPRGPSDGNFERRGLCGMESGEGQAHCRTVFDQRFVGQAGVQEKSSGSFRLAPGECGTSH